MSRRVIATLNTLDVISPAETLNMFRTVGEFSQKVLNRLSSLMDLLAKLPRLNANKLFYTV